MKPLSILIRLTLATASIAIALPERDCGCLSTSQAESIIEKYIAVLEQIPDLQTANLTAQSLVVDNYTEFSGSLQSLQGKPLDSPTVVGKDAYVKGVLSQPPVKNVTSTEIIVVECTRILWAWNILGVGSGEFKVEGFNLITTEGGKMSENHLEFNSFAWAQDIGYKITPPSATGS